MIPPFMLSMRFFFFYSHLSLVCAASFIGFLHFDTFLCVVHIHILPARFLFITSMI